MINKKERFIGLDILRLIAMMSIFGRHSYANLGCSYGVFTDYILSGGAIGVLIYFILSGFTLYLNYSDRELLQFKEIKPFYIKRFISIVPAYYATAIIYVLFLGKETVIDNLFLAPIEMLGLQTVYTSLFTVTHNGGTWFISCIIICYFVYPLLQEIIKNIKLKTKIVFMFICWFIILLSPCIIARFGVANTYDDPFFRLLDFTLGMLLASIIKEVKIPEILTGWPAFIIESVLLFIVFPKVLKRIPPVTLLADSLVWIPLFLIMLVTLSGLKSKLSDSKIIRYLSAISYGFFLAQILKPWDITMRIINLIGIDSNKIRIVISFAVITVIGILLHEFVEKPSKKILTKLLLKDARSPGAAS